MRLLTSLFVFSTFIGFGQTFNEIIKFAALDRDTEDRFGWAVDISGDYAIVGAYADDFGDLNPNMGSAYIFEKTGIDDWVYVQKIFNSDQEDYDRFGWSVGIDGDLAVIGAYGEDDDVDDMSSMSKAGSAYIFERNVDGVWEEVQKIVASDREEGDEFGWTVDVSGTTIIVGAHHEDHDEAGEEFIFWSGSVYVFDRNDEGVWEETQKLVAWDRQPDAGGGDETMSVWHYTEIDYGDLFGCSLALSGDFMIVGAHNGDYNPDGVSGLSQAGAAYIFNRVDGVWEADQKVCATVRSGWDRYGYSVSIDSNVAVVGAKAEDHSETETDHMTNAGSAYIYTRDEDGNWSTIQKIDASDRAPGDHFGIDVSVDGNYMVIGAESNNFDEFSEDELNNSGSAYIFEKDGDGVWNQIQKIDASDRRMEDWFANSIAISEHTILSGAWQQDLNAEGLDSLEDAGAAYFFSSLICEEAFYEQEIDLCAGESLEVGPHVYTETGEYTDTLLSIDACDSIVTTYLFVEPVLESSQSFTICHGEQITVGESVYTESGEYEDIFSGESGCDSTVYTTLEVLPEIDVTVAVEDLFTLTGGDPDIESTTFQWIKCDPIEIIDGATEQTYTATEDGEYAVIITDGDCVDTSACVTIAGIGYEDWTNNTLKIYPNPTQGQITIELDYTANNSIMIYNNLGAVVYKSTLKANKNDLNLEHLSPGVYILKIESDQTPIIRKIELR